MGSRRPKPRGAHARNLRLDGIRGLAVLLVLLYHTPTPVRLLPADSRLLPGGWIGVDVFFVLSGYLITHLLLREWRTTGRIDRRAFYGRRLRRLAPALAVALAVWVLASVVGLLPVRHFPTGSPASAWLLLVPVVSLATLVFNWVVALDFVVPTPFGTQHLWSLSIEEQFYVVWPSVIVFVVARARDPERALARLVVVAAGYIVLLTAIIQHVSRGVLVYASSTTRSLGLVVGAAVAVWAVPRLPRFLGELGLAVIVASAVFLRDGRPAWTPWMVLATCLATAALITSHSAWIERLLTLGWLRYAGRRSYALYLWSIPIEYACTVHLGTTWPATGLTLAASLLAAELSWRLVERRFASRAPRVTRPGRRPLLEPAPLG